MRKDFVHTNFREVTGWMGKEISRKHRPKEFKDGNAVPPAGTTETL